MIFQTAYVLSPVPFKFTSDAAIVALRPTRPAPSSAREGGSGTAAASSVMMTSPFIGGDGGFGGSGGGAADSRWGWRRWL